MNLVLPSDMHALTSFCSLQSLPAVRSCLSFHKSEVVPQNNFFLSGYFILALEMTPGQRARQVCMGIVVQSLGWSPRNSFRGTQLVPPGSMPAAHVKSYHQWGHRA